MNFILSYKLLYRHFKCIGYCNEGFKAWLVGVRHPFRYDSRVFAKQLGKMLVAHVLLCKNDSYSVQKFTLHWVHIDFSYKDKVFLRELFALL